MWGERPPSATEDGSGALPGLHAPHFPFALMDAAGLAAHPVFTAAAADIAGKEVVAGKALDAIGRGDWSNGPTSPGLGIFPRQARALVSTTKHFRRGSAGIGQIAIVWLYFGRGLCGYGSGRLNRRLILVFIEERAELIREAATTRHHRDRKDC